MNIRVAGLQMAVGAEVARNAAAIRSAIARAADEGASILLTPEGSLSGYTPRFDPVEVGGALAELTDVARRARVGLALGTCFMEADGRRHNQIRFYLSDGRFLGSHSKILRCGSWDDPPEGELNDYAAAPLRAFDFAGLTVGGLICNDLWANPECTPEPDPRLTQRLAAMGARVIFHAVNGGRDGGDWSKVNWQFHESNLRMRAKASRVWIVTVDSAAPVQLPCSAPSGVIDPKGNWVARAAPQGEQFFVYTIEAPDKS